MRKREYVSKAERRIERFTHAAHARIIRTVTLTLQRLERERVEYLLFLKRTK
jgi:hypothetical protein